MFKKGFIALIILNIISLFIMEKINNFYIFLTLSFFLIIFFNIKAISENDLKKYIFYGFVVQSAYVILDSSISGIIGKSSYFGIVQLLNFTLAGILLIVSVRGSSFQNLKINNYSLFGILVSCLALAGLPGFNLFVGEFYLYVYSYTINPLILCACFICSLLTLLTYLNLISHACAKTIYEKPSKLFKANIIILSLTCIILGIIPKIQIQLIEALI
jgi:formate hydrogenlyase subunit 3/multisubunit Na+/H+ antiporter MnhD subunit